MHWLTNCIVMYTFISITPVYALAKTTLPAETLQGILLSIIQQVIKIATNASLHLITPHTQETERAYMYLPTIILFSYGTLTPQGATPVVGLIMHRQPFNLPNFKPSRAKKK